MGRHTISTQPRRGGASFTSILSATPSLASTLSVSSASSTHTSALHKQCFYCPKVLADDSARRQHIADTPECSAAEHATLQRATERQQAERQQRPADTTAPASKRSRVTVEETLDKDAYTSPERQQRAADTTAPAPASKRPRVAVEETLDEDAYAAHEHPSLPGPSATGAASTSARVNPPPVS